MTENESPRGTLAELHEKLTQEGSTETSETEGRESIAGDIDLAQLIDTIGASGVAELIIAHTNKKLADAGLTPVSDIQVLIVRLGLAGCIEKYKDRMGGKLEPEIILAAGGVWVLVEKYLEAKALRKKKADETQARASE